jgi:primosomal replication protein N
LNRVELSGRLAERGALRHTPAGIAMIEFRVRHASQASEAGGVREVNLELDAVAFEGEARLLSGTALDRELNLAGFLCARSRRSRKPVLHVTQIEFVEGV